MSKKCCEICGQKISNSDIFCQKCGIPLASFKNNKKNKLLVKPGIVSNDVKVNGNSVLILNRLDIAAKCVSVVALLTSFILFFYFLINADFLGIFLCVLSFLVIPFISLPFIWMKAVLENIMDMNKKI